MFIKLYNYTGELSKVDKALLSPVELEGYFRDNCDILNPVVTIESAVIPSYNYAYIPELNRYYFINDIVIDRRNVYTLFMKVDVLNTYSSQIFTHTAFVRRCSKDGVYNLKLVDDRFSFQNNALITEEIVEAGSLVNTTFDTNPSGWNYVVNMINLDGYVPASIPRPAGISSSSGISNYLNYGKFNVQFSSTMYVADSSSIAYIGYNSVKDSELASAIKSIVAFPFPVSYQGTYPNNLHDVIYGATSKHVTMAPVSPSSNLQLPYASSTTSGFQIIADFTIPSGSNFYDYEPYTKYELFIPYVGYVQLKANQVLGKRLLVYYNVNYEDGSANAYLYNYSDDKVIYSSICQIGVKLSLTTTNNLENTKLRQNNNTALAINSIASIGEIGLGAFKGNPYMTTRGVVGLSQSISSYVTSNNSIMDKSQVVLNGGESAMATSQKVILKKTTSSKLIDLSNTDYKNLNGYVTNKPVLLSTLKESGYAEIDVVHLEIPNILIQEEKEITQLLSDGVHL